MIHCTPPEAEVILTTKRHTTNTRDGKLIVVGVQCVLPSPFPNGYIVGDASPMVGSVIEFKSVCLTFIVVALLVEY